MTSNNHTLVLNKNWSAVTVTSPFGAIISMCRGRSMAMCTETYETFNMEKWIERSIGKKENLKIDQVIRTPNIAIEKPEIIILKDYKGIPFTQVNFTRRNIYRRDDHTCQYCSEWYPVTELTIDHVVPKSRGGNNSWENCVTACKPCNYKKSNRTPAECSMKLLKLPRMPRWTPIAGMMPVQKPESWDKFVNF